MRHSDAARVWAAMLLLFAVGMLVAILEGRTAASAGDQAGLLPPVRAPDAGTQRPAPPAAVALPAAAPRSDEEHARLREAQSLIDSLIERMRRERAPHSR